MNDLRHEQGFAALREALAASHHQRFDELQRSWKEIRRRERLFGETPITRHERTAIYAEFLTLAQTCTPPFDLNEHTIR